MLWLNVHGPSLSARHEQLSMIRAMRLWAWVVAQVMSGVVLQRANFSGAKFIGSQFARADATGANLANADFTGKRGRGGRSMPCVEATSSCCACAAVSHRYLHGRCGWV